MNYIENELDKIDEQDSVELAKMVLLKFLNANDMKAYESVNLSFNYPGFKVSSGVSLDSIFRVDYGVEVDAKVKQVNLLEFLREVKRVDDAW